MDDTEIRLFKALADAKRKSDAHGVSFDIADAYDAVLPLIGELQDTVAEQEEWMAKADHILDQMPVDFDDLLGDY